MLKSKKSDKKDNKDALVKRWIEEEEDSIRVYKKPKTDVKKKNKS